MADQQIKPGDKMKITRGGPEVVVEKVSAGTGENVTVKCWYFCTVTGKYMSQELPAIIFSSADNQG